MSAPQNQPPYQPQYQAVPPYGQQRPRQNHVGKLVVAIILFVIGPLMGLAIWGHRVGRRRRQHRYQW